jgi:peptidyl-prolyl cis-trans isomerase SurA
MGMNVRRLGACAALVGALLLAGLPAPPARAQGDLFTPAVYVNDRVITRWEIEQNRRFLTLLRQPGDIERLAVERLIDDRLRLDAAQAAGISLTPEQIEAGMAEFAARANLSTEEFLAAIGAGGVEPEFFRSFVEAGLVWREVVRARFGKRIRITEAEIDRAMAEAARQGGVRVLLSELVLPANTPAAEAEARALANRLAGRFLSEGAFAAEAARLSVAPSRARGGRLDWLPAANLPPQIAQIVLGLAPGQVSPPLQAPNALVLFYLRDIEDLGRGDGAAVAVEWAEFVAGTREEAERAQSRADTCDDLYGIARGLPEERLRRERRASAEVPGEVLATIALLDDNESVVIDRGGQPVLLMLCARSFALPEPETPPPAGGAAAGGDREGAPPPAGLPAGVEAGAAGALSRAQVREQIFIRRLTAFAESYLAELRADATIRYQ